MTRRMTHRLGDIIDAIDQIDALLAEKTYTDFNNDRIMRAACERFLEILSEASRHIPVEMKNTEPTIEWSRIAGIGNHLRHAYQHVDAETLWSIHADGHLGNYARAGALS
jgi:uncharacterized protein with HEPN domain